MVVICNFQIRLEQWEEQWEVYWELGYQMQKLLILLELKGVLSSKVIWW
jgi:hypothetical protein